MDFQLWKEFIAKIGIKLEICIRMFVNKIF